MAKPRLSGAQRRRLAAEQAAAIVAAGGTVVEHIREPGRLDSVRDWRTELGKVYRDMRMGRIPAEAGTKLAFVANLGAQLAKVEEELASIRELREAVERTQAPAAASVEYQAPAYKPDTVPAAPLEGELMPAGEVAQ